MMCGELLNHHDALRILPETAEIYPSGFILAYNLLSDLILVLVVS